MSVDAKFHGCESKDCSYCGTVFYRDKRCTWAHWNRAKFCGRICSAKFGAKRHDNREPIEAKFWANVRKTADCWEWTWLKDKDGYGLMPYVGKMWRAHVLSLAIDGRPVSSAKPYACHTCDNPSCVRPSHLYAGTPTENMEDALDRGRLRVGSRNHFAKLSETAVRSIRQSTDTPANLAKQFGVSAAAIYMIRNGKTWRHVS